MKQTNINKVEIHDVNLSGVAFVGVDMFSFAPDEPVAGQVKGFRSHGTAQQLTDGSFEFVRIPLKKSQAVLIKKFAHGRASETKDGAIQLTLKVFCNEGVNISEAIAREAVEASVAIKDFQLKR